MRLTLKGNCEVRLLTLFPINKLLEGRRFRMELFLIQIDLMHRTLKERIVAGGKEIPDARRFIV